MKCIILISGIIIFFIFLNYNRMNPYSESFKRNLEYRIEIFRTSKNMISNNILLGNGNSFIKYNFHKFYNNLPVRKFKYINVYNIHCDLLEFLVEYGWMTFFLGLILFGIIIFYIISGKENFNYFHISAFSLLIYSLFAFPFHLSGIYPVFFLLLFKLSLQTKTLIELEIKNLFRKTILLLICILFTINFIFGLKFFSNYLKSDYVLNKYLLHQSRENLIQLNKAYKNTPYYYSLAYRTAIGNMKIGNLKTALIILKQLNYLRPEKTVKKNIKIIENLLR